jgi:hypothetical protein
MTRCHCARAAVDDESGHHAGGTLAQAFRIATEQRAATFKHVQELAWFRVAWTLLGVALSIPVWRLLGMVP